MYANNYFEEKTGGDSPMVYCLKKLLTAIFSTINSLEILLEFTWKETSRIKVEKTFFESNGWGMKIQASCMDNEIETIII